MEEIALIFIVIAAIAFIIAVFGKSTPSVSRDRNEFDNTRISKNRSERDIYSEYDANGYNLAGYNKFGKNSKGQYNRLFDTKSPETEGFFSPNLYPVAISTHARERIEERLGIRNYTLMDDHVMDAYRFGKSKRQIRKTSAYLVEDIENRHDDSVVLIYRNNIYIFSCENVLITVYKNNNIPL